MRKGLLLFAVVICSIVVFSQVKNPVSWKFSSKRIDTTTYEIHITAMLDDG